MPHTDSHAQNTAMLIHLAPMEGVIDHHLRRLLCGPGGIDMCVTEFIRVTDHLLPPKVFFRYCPELDPDHSPLLPCPVKVQLLGSNPSALAENAARAAELGAPSVDLNFGCPAKTVNRHRGGACLLDEPDAVHAIVSAVRRAVPASVPVTAKIRLGYHDRSPYLTNAVAIADAGACELVVHARSKIDGYKPPAYWHHIGEIRNRVPHIRIVANGEIWSLEDYHRCRQESGCDHVMLGRGLLAQPGLALAIKADSEHKLMTWPDCLRLLWQFHRETAAVYPRKHVGNRVKQWLAYMRRGFPQAPAFFERLKQERSEVGIEVAFAAELSALTPMQAINHSSPSALAP